jgi:hypothetical protein
MNEVNGREQACKVQVINRGSVYGLIQPFAGQVETQNAERLKVASCRYQDLPDIKANAILQW